MGTNNYGGHLVYFPLSFSQVVIPLSNIQWNYINHWYEPTTMTVDGAAVTDVVGSPYNVTLTNMGLPSHANHYWVVIGY